MQFLQSLEGVPFPEHSKVQLFVALVIFVGIETSIRRVEPVYSLIEVK